MAASWACIVPVAAIASALVRPQPVAPICPAAGSVKAVLRADDGPPERLTGPMDGPPCVPAGTPRAASGLAIPAFMPAGVASRAMAATPTPMPAPASATGLVPARGPPGLTPVLEFVRARCRLNARAECVVRIDSALATGRQRALLP